MTSQYRHRRTSNPATVFPNPIEPGEITVNTANRQIAVGDAASGTLGAPKPLLPIRYFDIAAQYVVNDFVVNGTALYRANKPTGPGPFVAADWVMMVGSIDPQYVAKAGDTMTGMLTLPATAPSAANHATNKTYVDGLVAAKSSVLVAATAPTGVIDSTLWYNTLDGQLYIRFNDGNSTQWVIAAPQPDASNYTSMIGTAIAASTVRYDAVQALTAAQQTQARQNIYAAPFDALAYSGMQVNGSMEVSQELANRTSSGYVCDGWVISAPGGWSYTAGTGNDPTASGITKIVFVSITVAQPSLAAGEILILTQPLEGYRIVRLAWGTANAQPITVGFWTRHNRPGVYSLAVRNSAANRSYATTYNHAVSNVAQYNTVTIPGDTAGTWLVDNNTGIQLTFAMAAAVGGTFTAPSANTWLTGNYIAAPGQVNGVAATSDAFRLTGVVVLPGIEAPSAARSPLIMRPFDQELPTCQRYWQKSYPYGISPGAVTLLGASGIFQQGLTSATNTGGSNVALRPVMRAAPAIIMYSSGSGATGKARDNLAGQDVTATADLIGDASFRWYAAMFSAATSMNIQAHWIVDARL